MLHEMEFFFQVLDFIVKLIESFLLDSFLVVEVIEGAGNEVVEDGLGLVDHVVVKLLLLVYVEKVHIGDLLDPEEVQGALLEGIALGDEQF